MLTIKNIKAAQGKSYFEQGYYSEGRWWGEGASRLNLNGTIKDQQAFNNLLDGYSPDKTNRLMARKVDPEKHRAAIDCTFNAPKSVSLQALVGGDERLIEAHRAAVNQTLTLMQERYAQTRIQKKGQPRQAVNTNCLAIAQFDHIETRELDPHLHTHCVVINVTQAEDGKWRSLHNDAIYRQQKLLGMVYQHHLALSMQKLGYQVVAKGKGQFEIAGYLEKDLENFSKRRQQILAKAGVDASVKERNRAWASTRNKKVIIPPNELKKQWFEEAASLGLKFVSPYQTPIKQTTYINPELIADGITHCSERSVAFKQENLEKFLLSNCQPIDLASVDLQIKSNPELIYFKENNCNRFTTQSALVRELATIRLMISGKGKVQPILSDKAIANALEPILLTEGQHNAITNALSTTDQFTAWQGIAGAGKTYALNHFKQIASANGYLIKGFAPSAKAAKVLENEVGIDASTVASILYSKSPASTNNNQQIWIVDEAGLLGANAAHSLLSLAKKIQARVLFVGDIKQLSAVEAGSPFKSLQQAGMATTIMNQSLRQRTPELQNAVDLIANDAIISGMKRLEEAGCVKEVSEEDKIEAIKNDYLNFSVKERDKTLILAGTNKERLAITKAIREKLKQDGSLGKSATVNQLKNKGLTKVQMKYISNFDVGDIVVPIFDYKKRKLNKGQLYEVVDKILDNLVLRDETGFTLPVDAGFEKAVYQKSNIEIAVGDRLKWNKNKKNHRRRNGQEFTVKAIEKSTATIEYKDEKKDTIDLNEAQYLDYAIVNTTYSSQGKTADNVLIAADSTLSKESFYVAVSRAKYNLKLYTSDKQKLLELALASRGEENPLSLLRNKIEELVDISLKEREAIYICLKNNTVEKKSQSSVKKPEKFIEIKEKNLDWEY